MSIIAIYGPVASGKLTTAKEAARELGCALFDNHAVNDILAPIFGYKDPAQNERRVQLSRQFRYEVFEAVLQSRTPLIVTFNYGGAGGLAICRKLVELSKKWDEPVYFVHLVPSKEALYERVVSPSRSNKANTRERLDELLAGEGYGYETFPEAEHIQIDNTRLTPAETVKTFREYYGI